MPGRKVKFGPGVRGRAPPHLPRLVRIDLPVAQPAGTADVLLGASSRVCANCGLRTAVPLRFRVKGAFFVSRLGTLPPPLRYCLALPCHACVFTTLQGSIGPNQKKLSLRRRQASQSGNLKEPMNTDTVSHHSWLFTFRITKSSSRAGPDTGSSSHKASPKIKVQKPTERDLPSAIVASFHMQAWMARTSILLQGV